MWSLAAHPYAYKRNTTQLYCTVVLHCCSTHLYFTVVLHCCSTLLFYTLVQHICTTLSFYILVLHHCTALLFYTSVLHCCTALSFYTLVLHCYTTLSFYTSVLHCCMPIASQTIALRNKLVGRWQNSILSGWMNLQLNRIPSDARYIPFVVCTHPQTHTHYTHTQTHTYYTHTHTLNTYAHTEHICAASQIVSYACSRGEKFKLLKNKTFKGHNSAGYACQPNFSPDGKWVCVLDWPAIGSCSPTQFLAPWKVGVCSDLLSAAATSNPSSMDSEYVFHLLNVAYWLNFLRSAEWARDLTFWHSQAPPRAKNWASLIALQQLHLTCTS